MQIENLATIRPKVQKALMCALRRGKKIRNSLFELFKYVLKIFEKGKRKFLKQEKN